MWCLGDFVNSFADLVLVGLLLLSAIWIAVRGFRLDARGTPHHMVAACLCLALASIALGLVEGAIGMTSAIHGAPEGEAECARPISAFLRSISGYGITALALSAVGAVLALKRRKT